MSAAAAGFAPDAAAPARVRAGALDAIALAAPLALVAEIRGGGRLFATELLLLALLPFLLHRHRTKAAQARIPALPILLLLVWLDGLVSADVYAATATPDVVRGWLKVAFTLATFVALYLLLENDARRYRLFATGLAGGLLLQYLVHPAPYALAYHWKYGVGIALTLAAAVLATTRGIRSLAFGPELTLGAAAVANAIGGFRSMGGVCVVAAALLALSRLPRASTVARQSPARVAMVAAAGLAVAYVAVVGYGRLAASGHLGTSAQQKYETQAHGGGVVRLFENGRPELVTSIAAIADSPLVGRGSAPRDPGYVRMLATRKIEFDPLTTTRGQIPEHSYLLGAWLEAGVLGALFWIWALAVAVRSVFASFGRHDHLLPLTLFAGLWLAWNILFAPYGGEERVYVPFLILLVMLARRRAMRGDA